MLYSKDLYGFKISILKLDLLRWLTFSYKAKDYFHTKLRKYV